MAPSMPSSCPVDEHQVGISIIEDFQKMRRRLYDGARAQRPVRDQPAKTIGNSQHRTRQLKLFCHRPWALFSPGSVVDNAANGAVTLRVGSIRHPILPPAHLHWQAAGGVRYSAVSTSSRVARDSLAPSDENTSGGRIFRMWPSCPPPPVSTPAGASRLPPGRVPSRPAPLRGAGVRPVQPH